MVQQNSDRSSLLYVANILALFPVDKGGKFIFFLPVQNCRWYQFGSMHIFRIRM